ncbi:MAG: hypothetical protein A2044_03355 [Candidatus Firestonebacteria bacterium GWA2_43_8]|nr:MAG: hypothetical protein A2044_03355 [Candidatus Firestonebacteria bacterium GWA2_43_8]
MLNNKYFNPIMNLSGLIIPSKVTGGQAKKIGGSAKGEISSEILTDRLLGFLWHNVIKSV